MKGLFINTHCGEGEDSDPPESLTFSTHWRVAADVCLTHVIGLYMIAIYFLILSQRLEKNHETNV